MTKAAEAILEEGLLTQEQVCAFLSISRTTLATLLRNGELSFTTIGKVKRIPKRAVLEYASRKLHFATGRGNSK